jgi:hypothetical protein
LAYDSLALDARIKELHSDLVVHDSKGTYESVLDRETELRLLNARVSDEKTKR